LILILGIGDRFEFLVFLQAHPDYKSNVGSVIAMELLSDLYDLCRRRIKHYNYM